MTVIIILVANDVVFVDLFAHLDFNDGQRRFVGIGQAVPGILGNEQGFILLYGDLFVLEIHEGGSFLLSGEITNAYAIPAPTSAGLVTLGIATLAARVRRRSNGAGAAAVLSRSRRRIQMNTDGTR